MNEENLNSIDKRRKMGREIAELEEIKAKLTEKLLKFQEERESLYNAPQDEEYFEKLSDLSGMESYIQREIDEIDHKINDLEDEMKKLFLA